MTLPELFAIRAAAAPQATALVCGSVHLTYAELDADANRLARCLLDLLADRARRAPAESVVALDLPRGPQMIIAMLAVLKAGAAFLPIDPLTPEQRRDFLLADSRAAALLTNTAARSGSAAPPTLLLDAPEFRERVAAYPAAPPSLSPDNLAYVIYTSGSSGTPKGVANTHGGLVNRLEWQWAALPYAADDVACARTSFNFVDSMTEILAPLLQGVKLVIADTAQATDPAALAALVTAQRVTRLTLVPGFLAALLDRLDAAHEACSSLRVIVCSGEKLPAALVQRCRALLPGVALWNFYGASEANGDSIAARMEIGTDPVPIGRPIHNTRVFVLDFRLRPVPPGATGALFIAGAGLARGYLGRPGLTAERFIACPFGPPGQRMYRTGDLARWRADGMIECLGRADAQIKLRGVRIEPAEIEAALCALPAIAAASVQPRRIAGETRLVAWVVPRPGATLPPPAALRAALAARLPAPMLPAAYVPLAALPRTASGKLHRAALPDPPSLAPGATAAEAPRDGREALLCQLFAELTGAAAVGRDDDFFDLGGHSLLALRLFARLRRTHDVELPLRSLFDHPTPAGLARRWRQHPAPLPYSPLLPLRAGGSRTPLFCVHPATGVATVYRNLAMALDRDQPVWGLQARGLEAGETPHALLSDMLEAYLAAIRSVQLHGPYQLLGWSFGGQVAHALAARLEAAGEPVAGVILLDTLLPTRASAPARRLADFLGEDDSDDRQALARAMLADAIRGGLVPDDTDPAWIRRVLRQLSVARALIGSHTTPRCAAPILLCLAAHEAPTRQRIAGLAWEAYTEAGVRRIECPARHDEMAGMAAAAAIAASMSKEGLLF